MSMKLFRRVGGSEKVTVSLYEGLAAVNRDFTFQLVSNQISRYETRPLSARLSRLLIIRIFSATLFPAENKSDTEERSRFPRRARGSERAEARKARRMEVHLPPVNRHLKITSKRTARQ